MEQIDRSGVRHLAWVVGGEKPVLTGRDALTGSRIAHTSASGPCALRRLVPRASRAATNSSAWCVPSISLHATVAGVISRRRRAVRCARLCWAWKWRVTNHNADCVLSCRDGPFEGRDDRTNIHVRRASVSFSRSRNLDDQVLNGSQVCASGRPTIAVYGPGCRTRWHGCRASFQTRGVQPTASGPSGGRRPIGSGQNNLRRPLDVRGRRLRPPRHACVDRRLPPPGHKTRCYTVETY